ncbi:MAG: CDP-alcohol phosphatidyltransferase family protein [Planctomycetales bacterium]|nr:CDP-alcohol phosphatidyltransferase family protein [Planctomycetales bacterium]
MKLPTSRPIRLLPTTLTLGNLLCGFFAVVLLAFWDSHRSTTTAGGLIVLGLVLDGLDGAVARGLNLTTRFGAVLDSLADLISFGVAPSVLLIALWLATGQTLTTPVAAAAAWLLAATALRLARVTFEPQPCEWQSRFQGLPCGAGGLFVASFALLPGPAGADWLLPLLPAAVVVIGLLMLSRVAYLRPAELLQSMRSRFAKTFAALLLLVGVLLLGGYALLAVCGLFIGSPLLVRASRSSAVRGSSLR